MEQVKKWRQYAFVAEQLAAREIKRKYARSALGAVWSVLNPLLSMGVLSLVFSHMFRRSIENFPLYYLTGYILWQAFTGATTSAMTSLADSRSLLARARFPMELFVLARVLTAFVNFTFALGAYGVMLLVFRTPVGWGALALFPVAVGLFFFSLGVSYALAAAYVFFGDVAHLYAVGLTLLLYCSALFYPVEQLSGPIRWVVEANPLYQFIRALRQGVLENRLPSPAQGLSLALWAGAAFLGGRGVFRACRQSLLARL